MRFQFGLICQIDTLTCFLLMMINGSDGVRPASECAGCVESSDCQEYNYVFIIHAQLVSLKACKVTLTVHGCLATPKGAPATPPVAVSYSLLILK